MFRDHLSSGNRHFTSCTTAEAGVFIGWSAPCASEGTWRTENMLTFCRRSSGRWRFCCRGDSEGQRLQAAAQCWTMWLMWRQRFPLRRQAVRPQAADPFQILLAAPLTGRDCHGPPQSSPSWWWASPHGLRVTADHTGSTASASVHCRKQQHNTGSSSRSGRRWWRWRNEEVLLSKLTSFLLLMHPVWQSLCPPYAVSPQSMLCTKSRNDNLWQEASRKELLLSSSLQLHWPVVS